MTISVATKSIAHLPAAAVAADAERRQQKRKQKQPSQHLLPPTKTSWRSIYVASALSFVGAVQFSLYFSSMWQYMRIIDPDITEQFYGYVIAIYSVGQVLSAPSFGWISNKLRQVRLPLQTGLVMMFVGNWIYIFLQLFEPIVPARYLLMMARFIIGVGSGNSSVLRSYASTASTTNDRSRAIAWVTCGQAIGQVAGPAFQLMFTPLSYPGFTMFSGFAFNMYTAPAYFACLMNLGGSLALVFMFKEQYAGIDEEEEEGDDENDPTAAAAAATTTTTPTTVNGGAQTERKQCAAEMCSAKHGSVKNIVIAHVSSTHHGALKKRPRDKCALLNCRELEEAAHHAAAVAKLKPKTTSSPSLQPYDKAAVFVCNVTRFTQMFIQGNLETIGGPLAMMMFAWDEETAVTATSAAQGSVGFLTLVFYITYIYFGIEKWVNLRWSNIAALIALLAFHLLTYSWPFLPNQVPTFSKTPVNGSDDATVGCNLSQFEWCQTLTQVDVRLYYAAYVLLIGFAFPALNIAMTTLFSYILGPRRQGTQQGVLQMSGGVSRLVGPVLMSELYSLYGPTMAWNMEIIVIGATILLWMVFYRRMVPLSGETRKMQKQTSSSKPQLARATPSCGGAVMSVSNSTSSFSRRSKVFHTDVEPFERTLDTNEGPTNSSSNACRNDVHQINGLRNFSAPHHRHQPNLQSVVGEQTPSNSDKREGALVSSSTTAAAAAKRRETMPGRAASLLAASYVALLRTTPSPQSSTLSISSSATESAAAADGGDDRSGGRRRPPATIPPVVRSASHPVLGAHTHYRDANGDDDTTSSASSSSVADDDVGLLLCPAFPPQKISVVRT